MLLNGAIPGAQEPGLDWGDRPTCLIIDRPHRLGEVNDPCNRIKFSAFAASFATWARSFT
jgi:hypothetical protein